MGREVTIEIYVLLQGRWQIHARYPESGKDAAIEEARSLDVQPHVEAVRVVREVYNTAEGVSNEYTIYKTPGVNMRELSTKPAAARSYGAAPTFTQRSQPVRAAAPGRAYQDDDGEAQVKPRKRATVTSVATKLVLILLFSLAVAFLMAGGASAFLPGNMILLGHKMVGEARQNALFLIFVGGFLVSAIPMALIFLSKEQLDTTPSAPKRKTPEEKPVAKEPEPEPIAEDEVDLDEDVEEDPFEDRRREKEEQEKAEANEARLEILSAHAEQQRSVMMGYLDQAMKEVKTVQKTLDNFNKFGVNLFLAGCSEALAKSRSLDPASRLAILRDAVASLGFKKAQAEQFAQRYPEYLMSDSRYMHMFQIGRNAMNTFLSGEKGRQGDLKGALDEWNRPKAREEKTRPITVMFTDMVGSTALTQSKGDAAAQMVVRAHNRIVRDALSRWNGREIKHTGDGIMASFESTSDGVEAAMQIQRDTEQHTKTNADLPLHLKIGINAGEPIAEDDDLFGTTVQLSARIVDKAKAGQIFVSEIVRGICAGKSIRFVSRGGYELKGFGDKLTLYEVVWKEGIGADVEPAAPAPAPVPDAAQVAAQAAARTVQPAAQAQVAVVATPTPTPTPPPAASPGSSPPPPAPSADQQAGAAPRQSAPSATAPAARPTPSPSPQAGKGQPQPQPQPQPQAPPRPVAAPPQRAPAPQKPARPAPQRPAQQPPKNA